MKKIVIVNCLLLCLILYGLSSCSKENGLGSGTKAAVVKMEISFSPNYLDYDWTVNVQLVSQAGSSLQMNGMDWDGVDHPNDRTTWFESDLKRISAGTYTMESSAKVNAATIAGTFLTGTDSEGTGNLVVLFKIYADDRLVRTETISASQDGELNFVFPLTPDDF